MVTGSPRSMVISAEYSGTAASDPSEQMGTATSASRTASAAAALRTNPMPISISPYPVHRCSMRS